MATSKQTVDIVEITWWMPRASLPVRPDPIVDILNETSPDFLPIRYGAGDPPPFKVGASLQGFREYWAERIDWGGGVISWLGSPPALGFSISSGFAPFTEGTIPVAIFTAQMLCDLVPAHRIAALLTALADGLDVFYACAFRQHGYTMWRGLPMLNVDTTEWVNLWSGTNWLGLPHPAPWLAWYGPEYLGAIKEPSTGVPTLRGQLLGQTDRSPGLDETRRTPPSVHPEFLATRSSSDPTGPPTALAAVIPSSLRERAQV